jgi:hypothetical protein
MEMPLVRSLKRGRKLSVEPPTRGLPIAALSESLSGCEMQSLLAPSAVLSAPRAGGWSVRLNQAELRLAQVTQHRQGEWGAWEAPVIDVVCMSSLDLKIPVDQYQYGGRSHSLWFGDIQEAGQYGWFETAFMISPLMSRRAVQNPFSLDPGTEAAKAIWSGMAEFQVAWPFTPLIIRLVLCDVVGEGHVRMLPLSPHASHRHFFEARRSPQT